MHELRGTDDRRGRIRSIELRPGYPAESCRNLPQYIFKVRSEQVHEGFATRIDCLLNKIARDDIPNINLRVQQTGECDRLLCGS